MTLTNPPAMPVPGSQITVNGVGSVPAFGKPVVDSLAELDARTSDPATGNSALGVRVTAAESGKVPTARTVTGANGLQGGGDLSADRAISPLYGTDAGTVAEGNDARITITQDATKGNNALHTRVAALENGKPDAYATRVVLAADQANTANAGYYKVAWPDPERNTGFAWNPAKDAFTVPATGWYSMGLSMRFDGTAAPAAANSERAAWVSLASDPNAARLVWASNTGIPRPGEWPKTSDAQPVYLTAGTELSVWTYQNSGGDLNLKSFAAACALNVVYLGN
ncbi:hypothetical protein CU254_14670 [Amycolatopsis sp. AA4]|uniref:hypothetical protein n=1 Tax=Actinomycetes TaxID=1760 RepID=UPI0001B54AD1|nr:MULTISPECIES: hypothetical protein [Actinomycetes]ATY11562.1 hypothetical protein CU254_14670 [Amycolatopsis sp. AA4]